MVNILIRFTSANRRGDWEQSLHESSNMLPYIISAGHHNYSFSLPLYLSEMHELKNTAPEVWSYFMKGYFVVRRKDGSFNGVPADMALEQTYNRDAKESASGLSGITLDVSARTKWVYTKPITSEVSTQFKQMLNIGERGSPNNHNEGKAEEVSKIIHCIEDHMINPFRNSSKDMINLATGQTASSECLKDLCNIEKIGRDALNACLQDHSVKVKKIKLHTFETMKTKSKKQIHKHPLLREEMTLLKRIFLLKSSGMDIDLEETIGMYECSATPPSLFEGGSMRKTNKAMWLNAILRETEIEAQSELPEVDEPHCMIVDAMYFLQQHAFIDGETFQQYQERLLRKLMKIQPPHCTSIHFPGDRYDHLLSTKECERQKRQNTRMPQKEYEIVDVMPTPPFREFMASEKNKAKLLNYTCEKWEQSTITQSSSMPLYLSGGFTDELKSIKVNSDGSVIIPQLSSTQEECDTRIALHAIFSAVHLGAKRVVVYCTDTDIMVILLYYSHTLLKDVQLWIKKADNCWIPLHEIASKLGSQDCKLQPFLYAFSGKDDSCSLFNLGKSKIVHVRHRLNTHVLAEYGEHGKTEITEDIKNTARILLMTCYTQGVQFESLAAQRAHLFLSGGHNQDMRSLPPTEDAFQLHLKRSLFATLVQKQSHIPVPNLPDVLMFGWRVENERLQPQPMLLSSYPETIDNFNSCKCITSLCRKNCSCHKAKVPCCAACRCEGKAEKCDRVPTLDIFDIDELDSDEAGAEL